MRDMKNVWMFCLCVVLLIGSWMISDVTKSIAAYGDSATHNTAQIASILVTISNELNGLNDKKASEDKQIFDAAEAAEYLGIAEQILAKLLDSKDIPALQINSIYRFSKRALDEWVYEQSKKHTIYQK
ncbi:excisionase [Brevibacillus reuszeri]|uniref:Excisionase n=3 Tax=Brevibacillus reuszeri TaxID=54915 RepID=A0A0K9Z072_9BACL|nr:excisionase [Brevibacillus reuszeri]